MFRSAEQDKRKNGQRRWGCVAWRGNQRINLFLIDAENENKTTQKENRKTVGPSVGWLTVYKEVDKTSSFTLNIV